MILLAVTNLKKYYGNGDSLVKAVDDITFTVNKGEFITVVGKSGSGKSTLLNLIGGLDTADSGEVMLQGKTLFDMKEEERTIFRRRNIGFVFQNFNLLPELTVYKNIILPVRLDGIKLDQKYMDEVIQKLEIEDKLQLKPNQLSGGQQQRVAIARALSMKPNLLLADEPTGNLDSETSGKVLELLQKTTKELGQTILMITHNEEMAAMSDRILCIQDGKIQEG